MVEFVELVESVEALSDEKGILVRSQIEGI